MRWSIPRRARHCISFPPTPRCWPCGPSWSGAATRHDTGSRKMPDTRENSGLELRLGHLYPDQLNMYGDRGNIITLRQRCAWRGITLRHITLGLDEPLRPEDYDMLFIGGGQDKEQDEVARDLREVKA